MKLRFHDRGERLCEGAQHFAALLLVCAVAACKGVITSASPLITPADATYPFPHAMQFQAQTLTDDHVWEVREGTAHLLLEDRFYRVQGPDNPAPSPDTFLFKKINDHLLIVQGSNGTQWAYGLIEHRDMYYLFTFNRADGNCTTITVDERREFNTALSGDRCSVATLDDLTGLLLRLRQRFPFPTTAFTVRP